MASGQFARGRLQRPEIRLAIAPVHHSAWSLFARHHYLSGAIRPGAKCFAAFWGETPVAFSAWMQAMTRKRRHGDMREHRTVVLPDFQGIGIGNRLSEFCASLWRALGGRAYSTTSHPGMIHYRSASPLWRRRRLGMASTPSARSGLFLMLQRCGKRKRYPGNSCARITGGFEYVGPAFSEGADRARALIEARPAVFQKRPSVQRVEAAVRTSPGSTVGRIARVTGLTTSCARTCLEELIEAGDVRSAGRGGQADPLAFYPY
jgi:GNAT superfamily N-acetyltransferase